MDNTKAKLNFESAEPAGTSETPLKADESIEESEVLPMTVHGCSAVKDPTMSEEKRNELQEALNAAVATGKKERKDEAKEKKEEKASKMTAKAKAKAKGKAGPCPKKKSKKEENDEATLDSEEPDTSSQESLSDEEGKEKPTSKASPF